MLNNDSLNQLKQLKQSIEDQKEYAEGVVKGTQRRFGFVILEDGREIYLSPDEMQKVFPGDRVRILITSDKKKKPNGTLEALLESTLTEFTGRYVVKGQGHFVEPDLPRLSRWIFIPPSARKEAKVGDFVHCKISRHPYPQAKPQAKVLRVIGAQEQVGIEADYVIAKFGLQQPWPQDWQDNLEEVDSTLREDLSDLPFVTIDAASTLDLDDALYARASDDGWQLQVAIADPCALIAPGSALDQSICERGSSIYLPGQAVAMLPQELANDICSLAPKQLRPALVCQMEISADGSIASYQMLAAMVQSQAKLSYQEVADSINNTDSASEDCLAQQDNIAALQQVATALRKHRQEHHLVIDGRQDYHLILDEQRKLARIDAQEKNSAHILVEECMVATNRCASDMLGTQGIFIGHEGFRSERLPDVRKLAEEQLDLTETDFAEPQGYNLLMHKVQEANSEFPLRNVLSRLLTRSRLSASVTPHYGMGLPAYTTFTSPIRKYSDFLVHRQIRAKLLSQTPATPTQEQLDSLQQTLDNARQARFQMEQWLKCQYMQPLLGKRFKGQVSQVNSNGFTVRLDENYIEGFVETRQLDEKYSFDPMRLRLKSKSRTIELDQAIEVVVQEVNCDQRSIRYTITAPACESIEADQPAA